jgi:uncharacterized membrane protein HdeD (DUF308 family)
MNANNLNPTGNLLTVEEKFIIPEIAINWKWMIVRGVISLIFGVLVVFYPFKAAFALALFFGAYAFADGFFAIVSLFTSRIAREHFWSFLVTGVTGIAAGILIFLMPELSLYGLILLVTVWAIVTGIFDIISAIKLRKIIDGEFLMIVSGLLSIVFGVFVFIRPLEGLVVMTYLIGFYAVMFGILYIILGFSMRKHQLENVK